MKTKSIIHPKEICYVQGDPVLLSAMRKPLEKIKINEKNTIRWIGFAGILIIPRLLKLL